MRCYSIYMTTTLTFMTKIHFIRLYVHLMKVSSQKRASQSTESGKTRSTKVADVRSHHIKIASWKEHYSLVFRLFFIIILSASSFIFCCSTVSSYNGYENFWEVWCMHLDIIHIWETVSLVDFTWELRNKMERAKHVTRT